VPLYDISCAGALVRGEEGAALPGGHPALLQLRNRECRVCSRAIKCAVYVGLAR
jgi:hypothetical protein